MGYEWFEVLRVDVMQLNAARLNYSTSATCKANNQTTQAAIGRNLTHSVSLAAQVHVAVKLGPSEHVFTPGDGILEQASTHHTDYTKLNTALC